MYTYYLVSRIDYWSVRDRIQAVSQDKLHLGVPQLNYKYDITNIKLTLKIHLLYRVKIETQDSRVFQQRNTALNTDFIIKLIL